MSHFLQLTYDTLSDYTTDLDILVTVRMMLEVGLPVNENWVVGRISTEDVLKVIFGCEDIEEDNKGLQVPVSLNEKQVGKVRDFIKGKFESELSGDEFPVEVRLEGIHFGVYETPACMHEMFDDFFGLSRFLIELQNSTISAEVMIEKVEGVPAAKPRRIRRQQVSKAI
jgi:hypothetical protein